jgi:hypothetical protein
MYGLIRLPSTDHTPTSGGLRDGVIDLDEPNTYR